MSAVDRALNLAPEAFNAVHMGGAAHIFTSTMPHCLMLKPLGLNCAVGKKFVGLQRATRQNAFFNQRMQRHAANIRHNLGHNVAATLQHTEHNGLASRRTATLALTNAANHGFIRFDVLSIAAEWGLTINRRHVFADLMPDAPRAFVGDSKLALQFLGRNTVARRGEKINGIKPFLHRSMAVLKWGARHRINVVATKRAAIGGAIGEAQVEIRELPKQRRKS